MVALKAHEVDRFLRSPPDIIRLFLVYGSDSGAITERVRGIEQYALKRGRGENVIRIGSDELAGSPGRIADEANSASLFGGEPVISLRVLDGRHNVAGAMAALFERPPEAAWVIVEAGELNTTSPLRKAFESSKQAAALPTFELSGKSLTDFIRAAAEEAGLPIEQAALELLEENLGGDRLAVRGELEKLTLYARDNRAITVADVEAVVGDTTGAQTDEVIDAALLGESEALETGLGRLRADGTSPASLGAVTLRHLLQLQSLRAAIDSGQEVRKVLDYARPPVFSRRRPNMEAVLSSWQSINIRDARERIDHAIWITRTLPAIEESAISEALHQIAITARRLKRAAR